MTEPKLTTLILYMKSGNQILVRDVETWNIKGTGDEVTDIKITRSEKRTERGIIGPTICLSQIEAIEEVLQ